MSMIWSLCLLWVVFGIAAVAFCIGRLSDGAIDELLEVTAPDGPFSQMAALTFLLAFAIVTWPWVLGWKLEGPK